MIGVIVGALEFFWLLILVFLWAIFIFFTMQIARSKGHSPLWWGPPGLLPASVHRHHPAAAPGSVARVGETEAGSAASGSGAQAPVGGLVMRELRMRRICSCECRWSRAPLDVRSRPACSR
jgi:hypothetical protein